MLTDVEQRTQKRPGSHHHRVGRELDADVGFHPDDPRVGGINPAHSRLFDVQP
jgi:hypothetical protein